jgi:hypothetical protein
MLINTYLSKNINHCRDINAPKGYTAMIDMVGERGIEKVFHFRASPIYMGQRLI